jgi:hypothetical protein
VGGPAAWFRDPQQLPAPGPRSYLGLLLEDVPIRRIGLGLTLVAAVVYVVSNPLHSDFYNHFVWQAQAWLQGRLAIAFPVSTGPHQNSYFQDVIPDPGHPGLGILPFPPLPALVLVPVVALMGLATPAALIAALLGAVNVGLAWRLCRRLAADRGVALVATIFFGFGTVAWYAAAIGSTWFLAHVVALALTLLAVTVALDGDAAARVRAPRPPAATDHPPSAPHPHATSRRRGRSPWPISGGLAELVDRRAFVAGLLLGLAALSRLTVAFGAPFLVLVGSGTWRSRLVSAAVGVALPLAALAAYNLALTGHLFNPAYAAIARAEYHPVPALYHANWGVEDVRYIPQNLALALFQLPALRPQCGPALLDPSCGTLRPDPIGMGLVLSSPGYLLLLPAVPRVRRDRLAAGALAAVVLIGLADLAHFSQGWVQFGWRFSNDFAPFALVAITLVMARWGLNRWVLLLVGLSVAINLWGVYWGVVLGW